MVCVDWGNGAIIPALWLLNLEEVKEINETQ